MKIKCTVRRRAEGLLLVALSLPLLMAQGCPPPAETPITADAGPDQSVQGGQTVTLDASGSTDDDPLTFAWTQTAGTSVTLNNADGAQATFTAPNVSETLTFQVTVSDGDEQDSDTVNIIVTSQALNQAPTANAGADQTVDAGAAVTMDGSASSDPDGDTLTFNWTQTSGTTVTLFGATTAQPTFVAPSTADTLVFQLTVSDATQSATDTVTVEVQSTPKLFVSNFGGNVVAYEVNSAADINGNLAPDANLGGVQTQLNQTTDVVIDSQGALLVSNVGMGAPSILVFENADQLSPINGNVTPQRNVSGGNTQLNVPESLAFNSDNDNLYVSDSGSDSILTFANAADVSFNGNIAPTRIIDSTELNNPFGIDLGTDDTLYVANNGGNNILVYANAGTINGVVSPNRTITSTVFLGPVSVFVDDNNRMFVVDQTTSSVYVFNNAATLNGAVQPNFTLQVSGAVGLIDVVVGADGRGYVSDLAGSAVYSFANIATRNGTVTPDTTLFGTSTQLTVPQRAFILD
jgi:6-phosphogluconolactonase (cycloisomerase 2 family)